MGATICPLCWKALPKVRPFMPTKATTVGKPATSERASVVRRHYAQTHCNRPLTEAQTKRNRYLSKTRYVVEQSFGTLHRKFRYARAAYFGLCKVSAQKSSEGDDV